MKIIEDYIAKLRCCWLPFNQKSLVRAIRDLEISEKEALERLKAYDESRGLFSRWMHEAIIGEGKLREKILKVLECMRILGMEIPIPDPAVQKFLDGGDLPESKF